MYRLLALNLSWYSRKELLELQHDLKDFDVGATNGSKSDPTMNCTIQLTELKRPPREDFFLDQS